MKYDYKAVEAKWQKVWEDEKTFHVEIDHKKPKFYALVEFPYPSGAGLHVGHPRSYTALDVVSRKRRQNGYNVLYPMGWDAFGLPTENFAMKNHIHPAIVTKKNVDHFREQLKALGFSFDWDREINTTDPEYYKWTQWIFLQLYKHGLAYKKEMNVNWCTGCKCVLANEEVVNGVCERCGSEVVHKVKSQWMLKITAYADKLIDGLDGLDYIERVATQQKNWIGRSHGAEVNFGTTAGDTLTVYTTRCDTLFGATYMVVSPEHAMVKEWLEKGLLKNADAVTAYQAEAARKSDFERSELNKEKTGVKLEGVRAVNPKAEVRVVWTKSWYDPAMEKSVAKNLIKEGADVIAQHQDSSGPQEAAQEQGTYSIGYNTDMSRVAPRAHMTSAIWSWNPVYENVVEQVRAGTWKNGSFWYGMETGVVDIAPYGPMVPQNVRDLTEAAKADIKSGKLVVFTGPIKDQKGVERIPTGMVPSDKELLGMDWFVEGVIGTID